MTVGRAGGKKPGVNSRAVNIQRARLSSRQRSIFRGLGGEETWVNFLHKPKEVKFQLGIELCVEDWGRNTILLGNLEESGDLMQCFELGN